MNKNLRLDNIQVYGFDYDYTLAHYSANLQSLIYDLATQHMVNEVCSGYCCIVVMMILSYDGCCVNMCCIIAFVLVFLQFRYPEICMKFKYDPTFPIRGLYYDKKNGCLLKLDFFGSIEQDGCYFGRRKVLQDKLFN